MFDGLICLEVGEMRSAQNGDCRPLDEDRAGFEAYRVEDRSDTKST